MNSANVTDTETEFRFKEVVADIRSLPFEKMSSHELSQVWYLSWVAAIEFAEALRLSLTIYPEHPGLRAMAFGELDATNLALGDFQAAADHHEFLGHFLRKHGVVDQIGAQLGKDAESYLDACRSLDNETRAMTVFSREEELAGIFARFLDASDWSDPGLYAFRHYLTTHIVLDSSEGGHHDLTSDFAVDDRVLPFYEARLESFRLVPTLADSAVFAAHSAR